MLRIFKKAKPESEAQTPFVTLNEACEILPKERVISIHDAVKFLGRDPQTVESAIDLAISKDELQTIADAGTYVLAPVLDTPLTLSIYRADRIVSNHKGLRTHPRLAPARFQRASSGYRLVQIEPHPHTVGYGFDQQQRFLAEHMIGQKAIGPHALSFVSFLFHELRGFDLVRGKTIRTSEKVTPKLHAGFRFVGGKALFDFVSSEATEGVGAIGEVVL